MTVSYSTNLTGPLAPDWFEDRDTKEFWCGGRIDIYGLSDEEYYDGQHEYDLPIMDEESWDMFTDWLNEYTTPRLVSYEEIIEAFEEDTGHIIRWASNVFGEEE